MKWINYNDKYEVSNTGEIRNIKTKRVLRQFLGRGGYYRTQFDGKTRTVHRVVAMMFLPMVNGKDFVNHIDGDKQNNNAQNLEWCTRSENIRHAYDNNLIVKPKGELNGRALLREKDVVFIRKHYVPYGKLYTIKMLASKFGVKERTIRSVIYNEKWNN